MATELAQLIQAKLDAATTQYVTRNPRSKALHEEAIKSMPGGNTRTVLYASPFPVVIKSGKGYQVTSEDGHTQVSSRPSMCHIANKPIVTQT
jgi:glutamate-1-semialdehyde 2,1-aminomutase